MKYKRTTTYNLSGITFTVTEEVDDSHKFPTIVTQRSGGCGCGGGCGGAKKPAPDEHAPPAPGLDLGAVFSRLVQNIPPDLLQRGLELLSRFGGTSESEH